MITEEPNLMTDPVIFESPMVQNDHPDFTDRSRTENRWFTIDNDTFYCARVVPAGVGKKLALLQSLDAIHQFDGIGEILDLIMIPSSGEVFAKRMMDPENPISIEQVQLVINWMLREYSGGRPTTPSNNSLPSPSPDGTSSMDGAQLEVQTL